MFRHATSRFRAVALSAFVMGASTVAHAVDVAWGLHGPSRSVTQTVSDYFIDTYSFTLGTGSWQVSSAASTREVSDGDSLVSSIVGGTYGLYSDPDGMPESGDEALLGGTMHNLGPTTGGLFNSATVGQGSYYYLVTGLPLGTSGGIYRLDSAVILAVPEPSTAAFLLGGMALMSGVAFSRRARSRS